MSTNPSNASSSLSALAGIDFPGGCDDCHAVQRMDDTDAPLFVLRVFHDDSCPALAAHVRRNS